MKIRFVIFLLFGSLVLPARSYTRPQDVNALRESYDRLRADGSPANQRTFFVCFPSQWSDFTVMDYALDGKDGDAFYRYVEAFGELGSVDDSLYCDRLVGLACSGANFGCDATGEFYGLLHTAMGDSSERSRNTGRYVKGDLSRPILRALSRMLKGEIFRFWAFYWSSLYFEEDGGAANDEGPDEEYFRIRALLEKDFPGMLETSEAAYRYFHHGVIFQE